MLWSQINNGHRTACISLKIVRFEGAYMAPGRRQEESYDFFSFLYICHCPVKLRFYLKFHGAITAFGRVIEGKMTSARHRMVSGRRPAGVCEDWTGTGIMLFKIYIVRFQRWPGNVRCLTSARNFQKSLNKSANVRPGTGRCPSGYRPMFNESNSHR